VADPNNRKLESELNFSPIPSPIHLIGYEPKPSTYKEVSPGHLVLDI
jgi:peptide/nickel transport system ATP-binding protein/glutathione transport system ATP-binding protein